MQRNADGLVQTELAARVGTSQPTVSRAEHRGIITRREDGLFGPEAVEALRAYLTADAEKDEALSDLERQLTEARRDKERAQARLREMEVERESGRYVEKAEVERSGRDAALRMLAILRAIPQRTALAIEDAVAKRPELRAAAIERLVSGEVERAVGELRDALEQQAAT